MSDFENSGICMDAEVKKELQAIESRLSTSIRADVTQAIAAGFKDIKNIITELFNKDIGYLEKQQETFRKYHDEHYQGFIKINQDITGVRISISKEIDERLQPMTDKIDDLENRQIREETAAVTKEKLTEDRTAAFYAKFGALLAAAGGLGALISWLIENN